MKNGLSKIALAATLFAIQALWAQQSTYIITGSGTSFSAVKNGSIPIETNKPIQTIINAIKTEASGTPCIIQFGDAGVLNIGGISNGTGMLNFVDSATQITFNGGGTHGWGLITLTGKLATEGMGYDGIIRLEGGVSIDSKVEFENTFSDHPLAQVGALHRIIYNNSTGTVSISGGTAFIPEYNGVAIYNNSTGAVTINGGKVSVVLNDSIGAVTINGGTVSKVSNNSAGAVTISGGVVSEVSNGDAGAITINDGIVSGVFNNGAGPVIINGGLVQGGINFAIHNTSNGKITISGSAIVTSEETYGGTIYLENSSKATDTRLEIIGGTVSNTAVGGVAVYNASTSAITISGGTVLAEKGRAIYSSGKITVSGDAKITGFSYNDATISFSGSGGMATDTWLEIQGGTVVNTAANGAAVYNYKGKIIISGGIVDYISNDGTMTISNGMVSKISNYGTVTISGGKFCAVGNEDTMNISGGIFSEICDFSYRNYDYNSTNGYVENDGIMTICGGTFFYNNHISNYGIMTISGGIIRATTGYAVKNFYEGNINLIGGIIFAYGTKATNVIIGDYTQSGNNVIVAWNKAAGNVAYAIGTSDDIFSLSKPATATVVWAKNDGKDGIAVTNGTNIGFIEIDFNDNGTPIHIPQLANGVNIIVQLVDNSILLSNLPKNTKIDIYNLQGKRLHSTNSENSQILKIPVQTKGMYIVKVGTQTLRVAVR